MEAIATLIQNDPYLDLPLDERLAERRERRARLKNLRPPLKLVPQLPAVLASVEPPDYQSMWFYNLVFETEARLSSIIARPAFGRRRPRVDEIQREVARFYGVSCEQILSQRRTADIVRPRQVGYFLCSLLSNKSLNEIGRQFGARDHSSIFYGVRKIEALRHLDNKLQADLDAIAAVFGAPIR